MDEHPMREKGTRFGETCSVSAIVVNWNTRDLLDRCLQSISSSPTAPYRVELLVVDNASTDGSAAMVESRYPEAILLRNGENAGFARANNQAIRQATGDYLLLLNPDTEVRGSAILEMVRYAEEHPNLAVVGPRILNPDGSTQSSRRRFPTVATGFLESTVLQRWLPDNPVLRRFYLLDRADQDTQEVDWLVGACLLVRAAAVREVGLLDEGYFMYSEELDWCRRFARAGWKVVFHPAARIVHYGGQSSEQDILHRHTRFQYSKCRYFERYHGVLIGQLLRFHLLANYLYMLAEDSAKLILLRRRRSMRLRRMAVLGKTVLWMLLWFGTWGKAKPR